MLYDRNGIIYKKVVASLEGEKCFLDTDMSLTKLSRIVGTNTNYLSKTINIAFGCTFSDLMNHYRVEHVKAQLQKGDKSIEELVGNSGFRSRSSFFEVFRRETGVTPYKYARMYKQ